MLRVLPLALGWLFAVPMIRSQPAELPPIFAPRPVPSNAMADPSPRPSTPMVSEHLRSALNETATRLLAEAKVFNGSVPLSVVTRPLAFVSDDPVQMDQFVVKSTALRLTRLPPPDSALLRFIKTGTLYHKLYGKVDVEVYLNVLTVGQVRGLDRGREFTRLKLAFSFSW